MITITEEKAPAPTNTPAHITQAHFDEWVKESGVSSVFARHNLVSLDDPRVIVRLASQSTKAISEVL